ncbi:MucB/RseB C-terminal domain-containing protein [Alteromonadaceae bacterium BrNp21-10]|nr:MucB/RseB C-terminal domain-containing protein [Alteromonadaceae bacterium BrNp21-10]
MRIFVGIIFSVFLSAASAADLASETNTQETRTQESSTQEGSAQAWLHKMSTSLRTLNFDISFVMLTPPSAVEPYRWRHAIVDGKDMEHLSLLNGPGREIVRINDQVSYFEPNVPAYTLLSDTINGPVPGILLKEPLLLESAYDFVLVGRSRVSGRSTQQVRIISKDKTLYGFNLWLDQLTGLLLKMDMVDEQGKVIEQFQATSLQVSSEPAELFSRIKEAELPNVLKILSAVDVQHKWQINWLPVGMLEIKRDTHRLPVTGQIVDYMLFSDGLIDISIYLQKSENDGGTKDLFRHGSNTFFSTTRGPLDVTVVGKVPPQTANLIAQSISLAK